MVEAIIFDVDGTLLDTRELIRLGYVETLRAHGFVEQAERFDLGTLSKPIKENYQEMVGGILTEQQLAQMLDHHNAVQSTEERLALIMAYTGLEDMLRGLRQRNMHVGIFTSGNLHHVERNFPYVGVDPYEVFGAMVTADDEIARKPAPDGITLCLERLGGIPPENAVMVGDHAADMQAGRAAGVRATIGLLHGLGSRQELDNAGADYLIPSLGDLLAVLDTIEHDDYAQRS